MAVFSGWLQDSWVSFLFTFSSRPLTSVLLAFEVVGAQQAAEEGEEEDNNSCFCSKGFLSLRFRWGVVDNSRAGEISNDHKTSGGRNWSAVVAMMRFGWGKLVVLLVMSVAVLQIVHMLLLNRLELKSSNSAAQKRADDRTGLGRSLSGQSGNDGVFWVQDLGVSMRDLQDMVNAVDGSSVLDSSGEFKIVNFLVQAENLRLQKNGYEDVTLVTQCSSEHLPQLATLASAWSGPISVAVFVTVDNLGDTLITITDLRRCFSDVRANTSFHLVYPLSQHRQADLQETVAAKAITKWSSLSSSSTGSSRSMSAADCERIVPRRTMGVEISPAEILNGPTVAVPNYDRSSSPYPNNLLRNVARRNSLTEFVFVIDVDMVPNEGLHREFIHFAKSNRLFSDSKKDDKTVYVVPAFEAKESVEVPKDKTGLLQLLDTMQVRPFYFELCWKCQKHTDYDAWQREPISPQLNVIFEVLWKDPWEPFYVSRNTVPFYDERFKQYGFNRISQVSALGVTALFMVS